MTTSVLVINGLQKLYTVMSYKNRIRKVCRIYSAGEKIPEKLLEETIPGGGIFRDRINKLRFKHTREGMVAL